MSLVPEYLQNHLQGLQGHLQELRRRVLIIFLTILLCGAGAFFFAEPLAQLCMLPLFKASPDLAGLVYTNPTEAFITYLKVSILAGLGLAFPVILYQVWMFVAPGLYKEEKVMVLRIVSWAGVLFLAGIFFSFAVILPELLTFFMEFSRESLTPKLKLGSYLSFVIRLCITFSLAFEIPFLMAATAKTGLLTPAYFIKQRKYFYLSILVLAFLLSAGEILAALLFSIPIFGLYELGIIIMRLFKTS
ncbi:MAG: twin-arginine translocase subunit TatC [Thermodesulfobacteriota bacterium]